MNWRIQQAWDWLTGYPCPLCAIRYFGWCKHECPALKHLTVPQQVHKITKLARNTIADEPADKFVHAAYDACDKLDAIIERGAAPEEGSEVSNA